MIYRVTDDLAKGATIIPKGTVANLEKDYGIAPRVLAILESKRAIERVNTPPLEIPEGWRYRATRLRRAGITTVEELLEADVETLAGQTSLRAETIRTWQEEARLLLQ